MRRVWLTCVGTCLVLLLAGVELRAQALLPIGPPGGDVQALTALPGGTTTLYFGTPDGHIFGSADGGAQWHELGRVGAGHDDVVTALVVDSRAPRTLYASAWALDSADGGVFRSDDGGRNWRLIGLGGHAVRALAQAAARPELLVAGAVDGVYRSTDGGRSWERISPEHHEDLRNFDSIALDPREPDTIYAGTYHLAWKTTDAGRNWLPVQKGMIDDSDVMSISIDPNNPQHVFSSACSGIYQSADGGASWTKFKGIPSTSRRTVQIKQDPQHPEVVYAATTEGLWRTTDGGGNWKPITSLSWSILSMLIDPQNSQRLILGTERMGVMISEDGGATYHPSNSGFSHRRIADLAVDPAQPQHALVVLTNAIEPALETHDGGRSWQPLGVSGKVSPPRNVFAGPNGWWGAPAGGGLLHYEAGAWAPAMQVIERGTPARVVRTAATVSSVQRNAKPNLAASKPQPATLSKAPITAVVHDMAFGRGAWFAASDSGIFVSRDNGASWILAPAGQGTGAVRAISVSAGGGSVWAVAGRSLLVSGDSGSHWAIGVLPFQPRGEAHLYAADDSNLLLAGDQGLFESHDAGMTWRQSSLPELMVADLAVAGDAVVVTTRSGNLYASRDQGRSWTRAASDLDGDGFAAVRAVSAAGNVMAASATEGLFVLDLGGGQSSALQPADTPIHAEDLR